jgi:hypothetical protein
MRVAASARDADALERLAKEAARGVGEILPLRADLTEPDAAAGWSTLSETASGVLTP